MIDIFVINNVDYSLFIIGGIGVLLTFAAQYMLCCRAKSKWVKLIPVYFLLLFLAVAGLIADSSGSILQVSNVVQIVLLCISVLLAISIGAAWLAYKLRHKTAK